jgi:hypothetical protein
MMWKTAFKDIRVCKSSHLLFQYTTRCKISVPVYSKFRRYESHLFHSSSIPLRPLPHNLPRNLPTGILGNLFDQDHTSFEPLVLCNPLLDPLFDTKAGYMLRIWLHDDVASWKLSCRPVEA